VSGAGASQPSDRAEGEALDRVRRRIVAAGLRATGSTPIAMAVEKGLEMEKSVRRVVEAYQQLLGQALGFASRREVQRLQELVRALEHRLEEFEPPPSPPQHPRPPRG
jgi:hypothetical protein